MHGIPLNIGNAQALNSDHLATACSSEDIGETTTGTRIPNVANIQVMDHQGRRQLIAMSCKLDQKVDPVTV